MTTQLVQALNLNQLKDAHNPTWEQVEKMPLFLRDYSTASIVCLGETLQAMPICPMFKGFEFAIVSPLDAGLHRITILFNRYIVRLFCSILLDQDEMHSPIWCRTFLQKLLHFWGSALRSRHTDPDSAQPTSLPLCKVQEVIG